MKKRSTNNVWKILPLPNHHAEVLASMMNTLGIFEIDVHYSISDVEQLSIDDIQVNYGVPLPNNYVRKGTDLSNTSSLGKVKKMSLYARAKLKDVLYYLFQEDETIEYELYKYVLNRLQWESLTGTLSLRLNDGAIQIVKNTQTITINRKMSLEKARINGKDGKTLLSVFDFPSSTSKKPESAENTIVFIDLHSLSVEDKNIHHTIFQKLMDGSVDIGEALFNETTLKEAAKIIARYGKKCHKQLLDHIKKIGFSNYYNPYIILHIERNNTIPEISISYHLHVDYKYQPGSPLLKDKTFRMK